MSKSDQPQAGHNTHNRPEARDVASSGAEAAGFVQPEVDPFVNRQASSIQRSSFAAQAIMASITGYQRFLSSLKSQPTCRFYPTCSQYALEAVREHGAITGSWLAIKRISKCHPLHPGGLDPVPPARVRPLPNPRIRLLEDR
jgi:putative membrane protein insertion efficiency factor